MRSSEESLRILERALATASQGVDGAEAALGGGVLGLTRFADNSVHQSVVVDREVMTIRVLVGGRVGRSETSDYSTAGVQGAARQARMLAELLPETEVGATLPGAQQYVTVDGYDPETERATALDRMALAGRTIIRAHRGGLTASGYISTAYGAIDGGPGPDGVYAIANTNGLAAYYAGTRAGFSVSMVGARGTCGWARTESFALGDVDANSLTDVAAAKATAGREVTKLEPGPHTVVFESAAVAELVRFIGETCGCADVASGRSFLTGRVGEKIVGDGITIYDDHTDERHRGLPFDVEGVARKKVVLIEGGVAKGPVYSHASAAAGGVDATGHLVGDAHGGFREAARHLVMDGGDIELGTIVAETDKGVLVSRICGAELLDRRALVITATTRDGTFLIEDGDLVAPVGEMRFTVSLLDLLRNVDFMSPAIWAGGAVVPSIRVPDLMLA